MRMGCVSLRKSLEIRGIANHSVLESDLDYVHIVVMLRTQLLKRVGNIVSVGSVAEELG